MASHRRAQRTSLLLLLILTAAALAATPSHATPGSLFNERLILEDPEDQTLGGLDLVAVFATESYGFNPKSFEHKGHVLTLRLVPRDFSQFPANTPVRYTVYTDTGGEVRAFWVQLYANCSPPPGECNPIPILQDSSVPAEVNGTSVRMKIALSLFGALDADGLGLTRLTNVWAATSTFHASTSETERTLWHDVAPRDDDGQLPSTTLEPPENPVDLELEGPFPYATATPLGRHAPGRIPLITAYSALGQEVRHTFEVSVHPKVTEEIVYFTFDLAENWTANPNRGPGGFTPLGMLTNVKPGQTLQFDVGFSATQPVDVGDIVLIRMHMISSQGAHAMYDIKTIITRDRYDSPDHVFTIDGPRDLARGQTGRYTITVTDADGRMLSGLALAADLKLDQRVRNTLTAQAQEDHYVLDWTPTQNGAWTLDVHILGLKPSPHATHSTQVHSPAGAPGPEAGLLLGVLALWAWRRRA
jgi:hypothetical protein